MSRLTGATTRVVVALLSVVTVVLPNALAVSASAATCRGVSESGYWTTYDVQDFPGGGDIVSYAVDAFRPTRMFATDGTVVKRTIDGGCTWKDVYDLTEQTPVTAGFRGDAAQILSIHVPRTPGANLVFLRVVETAGNADRPHVVRSTEGGTRGSWTTVDAGLPPAGRPEALVVSPLDPSIAYLGVDIGGGSLDLLFASVDGGTTWTLRSDLTRVAPNRGIVGFEIDPMLPNELWAYGDGLLRSTDGGASFTAENKFATSQVSEVEVFHAPSRTNAIVLAFRPEQRDFRWNTTPAWERIDTPGAVTSAVYGRVPTELLISVSGRIYFFRPTTLDWIEVRAPRPGIVGLSSDAATEQDFYGHTAGTIEKYEGPTTPDFEVKTGRGPNFEVPGLVNGEELAPPPPPRLGPPDRKLKMKTGASRSIEYTLLKPEKRTPLDVFFLIDTSDTMSGTIQGLIDSVAGIINQLKATGLDVQFGLGVSRAYTDTAIPREPCESETDTNCERNFIYRRLVDLSDFSNADEIEAALASLRAEAGGRFDSQLGALWAIATGNEIDDSPPGMQPSDVPAGQDASFREGSLKLVFVATDEPFGRPGEDRDFSVSDFGRVTPPDIPTFDQVAGAMNGQGAKVLGLAIGQTLKTDSDSTGGAPTPLEDMRQIAGMTGAVAPPGGVDCDGDGVVDLAAGTELVCPVRRNEVAEGEHLATAITKLVQAVRGTTSIELDVVRGDDVVAGIEPAVYPQVVLQQRNALDYEVTYRCPERLAGKRVTVELAAKTPKFTLDSVTTTITCLEERVPQPPPLPVDPVVAFGLVLPPLLPPGPPPIAANAPSAQGQAQSQSQAQAQGAIAQQEQEQPQLAYVGATIDHREAIQEELAMSDYRRRTEVVPQWATLGTGAVMMSLAYGWLVVSRQRSVRVQRVRRR